MNRGALLWIPRINSYVSPRKYAPALKFEILIGINSPQEGSTGWLFPNFSVTLIVPKARKRYGPALSPTNPWGFRAFKVAIFGCTGLEAEEEPKVDQPRPFQTPF